MSTEEAPVKRDDYDSPWKDAIERYFSEFMEFYFPDAHSRIDWTKEHIFLDKELQKIVHDAELGRRYADKLVRVTLLTGEEDLIFIHVEVQGDQQTAFPERMFVYNYRIYDRTRRPVASLAILADESETWRPDAFGYDVLGCQMGIKFPIVKLADFVGREAELLAHPNTFALVTVAYLKARATRQDMAARFNEKWKLIQILYQRGWDRQRIIDLFAVLDWMMRLPDDLDRQLWSNIETLEEQSTMRYITSVERFGIEKGFQQGIEKGIEKGETVGEAKALIRLIERRFGPVTDDRRAQILAADASTIETWLDRLMDAPSANAVFAEQPLN